MIEVPGLECFAVTPDPGIQPRRVLRPRKDRRQVTFYDALTPNVRFCVHANSKENLIRGLTNRVMKYKGAEPILPTKKGMDAMYGLIRGFKCWTIPELDYESFLQHYRGRRLTLFRNAVESLRLKPLKKTDAYVSTFIKAEKFDLFAKGRESDPRMIQPRSYRYLAAVGRFIKPMEHQLYKHLQKALNYKLPCIAKGFNAVNTGNILKAKWDLFKSPVAISLDASRFDLHVSKQMLEWTHAYYRRFNRSHEFQRLLAMTLDNTGFAVSADYECKYTVSGRRMSGDMDTALGNCVIMACMTHLLMQHVRHEIFVNGDDCLIICEKDDCPNSDDVVAHYKEMGFHVKVEETVSTLESVEFCQTHPINRGEDWVMVRNISAIAKDFVMIGSHNYRNWLRAVGICGSRLADGIPIFSTIYKWMYNNGTTSRIEESVFWNCGMVNLAKGMKYNDLPVLDSTRRSFELAFGIDPVMQKAIEHYYSTLGPLGNIIETDRIWLDPKRLENPALRRVDPFAKRSLKQAFPQVSHYHDISSRKPGLISIRHCLPTSGLQLILERPSTDSNQLFL